MRWSSPTPAAAAGQRSVPRLQQCETFGQLHTHCLPRTPTILRQAYAAARFAESVLLALNGEKDVVECTFVESDVHPNFKFFASKVGEQWPRSGVNLMWMPTDEAQRSLALTLAKDGTMCTDRFKLCLVFCWIEG